MQSAEQRAHLEAMIAIENEIDPEEAYAEHQPALMQLLVGMQREAEGHARGSVNA